MQREPQAQAGVAWSAVPTHDWKALKGGGAAGGVGEGEGGEGEGGGGGEGVGGGGEGVGGRGEGGFGGDGGGEGFGGRGLKAGRGCWGGEWYAACQLLQPDTGLRQGAPPAGRPAPPAAAPKQ